MKNSCYAWGLAGLLAMSGVSALAGEIRNQPAAAANDVCSGEMRRSYAQADMAKRVKAYQVLTEEALSLREQAIAFFYHDEVAADSRRAIEALVKPEVLKVARGGWR